MRSQRSDLMLLLLAMVPLAAGVFAWISWQRAGEPYLPLPVVSLPAFPLQYQFSTTFQGIEQWTPPLVGQPLGLPGLIMVIVIAGVVGLILAMIVMELVGRARWALAAAFAPHPPIRVVSGLFRHDRKPVGYAEPDDDEDEAS